MSSHSTNPPPTPGLSCPKCHTVFVLQSLDPLHAVDFCPDCNGMWLKRGVLARSAGVRQDVPDLLYLLSNERSSTSACPACGVQFKLGSFVFTRGSTLEVEYCRKCEGIFLDCRELPLVQNILRQVQRSAAVEAPVHFVDDDPRAAFQIPYDGKRTNLLAVPGALLLGWVAQQLTLLKMLGWYLFEIPVHECGHALAAWLGGRLAIPIGAFLPMAALTVTMNAERSGPVYFLLVAAIGAFACWCWRRHHSAPVFLGGGLILIATYLTWIATDERSRMILTYGGLAGELVLSTLLIMGFHYQLPSLLRWDFFRFIGLGVGSYVYTAALTLWVNILRGRASLPMGSFLDGRDSSQGDVQRLLQMHGWSQAGLTRHFLVLGALCAGVILAHYFYSVRKHVWKRSPNML